MIYTKGIIEDIEIYKDFRIVIEHNLNVFEGVKDNESSIYTICGLGRCYQGNLSEVKIFVDKLIDDYNEYNEYIL